MKKRVLDYLAISFGAFLLALGMQFFLVPARFTTGGAGGVATILYYFFRIPVFLTVSGINLILFLFGFGRIVSDIQSEIADSLNQAQSFAFC